MLSLVLKEFSKRARAFMPFLVCLGLFCYFSVHFSSGDHGLEARDQLQLRVSRLQTDLAALQQKRKHYQQRLTLLEKPSTQSDLKDELARQRLQYAHPDDLILFE